MRPCLTLAEQSVERLEAKIRQFSQTGTMVEVRLDALAHPQIPQLPSDRDAPLLATCRPPREGGCYPGNEESRLLLLKKAARAGFDWVDLEQDAMVDGDWPDTTRIVRSKHCLDGFPKDLDECMNRLRHSGGDLFKLAVPVATTRELTRLLDWMECLPDGLPRIIIGMGQPGQPSRYLGLWLGNRWTYVSEPGRPAAPGQFPLEEAAVWPLLKRPSLYAVIGNPVGHSQSPLLHNGLFRHYGLDKYYLPLPLDSLETWFRYMGRTRLPFRGFSITLPFKTEILNWCTPAEPAIRSINTLTWTEEGWQGRNTDRPGFLRPLQARMKLRGRRSIVVGTGGVAHMVVPTLVDAGAVVTVVGRNRAKVESFQQRYGCSGRLLTDPLGEADLLVNTTPVGQAPEVDQDVLQAHPLRFSWVYDLVYNPPLTKLLARAREAGCSTISGREMFLEQAALQFHEWTGIDPDRELMKGLLRS